MSAVRRGARTPTRRASAVVALAATLAMVLAVGTAPSTATGQAGPTIAPARAERHTGTTAAQQRARSKVTVRVQRVAVRWKGTDRRKRYTRTAVVPGIGNATLVCRPDATMLRLHANDRSAETQMWIAKYETKKRRSVVAVKVPRIYTYSDAADDGKGGTGRRAHEGFNQRTPVENFSSGYMHGVISQRPGRHRPAGGVAAPPATSFRLTWWWNGFRHRARHRSCSVSAVFKTTTGARSGLGGPRLDWHGDADALGHEQTSATYPAIGQLSLRCETGRQGEASFWLKPTATDARVWAEYVTGEGLVESHVETTGLGYDAERATVGPLDLPQNGMMRLWWTVAGRNRSFIVSSYRVTNNLAHPELNVCEVTVAPW